MTPYSVVCRGLALTLCIAVSVMGIPLPTSAAGNEEPAGACRLTVSVRPLSQSLTSATAVRGRYPLTAALTQNSDGQINGVVMDATGQPVASQRVELSRPRSEGEGRIVATTDGAGQFIFSRLGPGRYEVELRENGRVIATSRPIELSAGAMRTSGVSVALPAPPPEPPPNRRRVSADRLLGDVPVSEAFNALQGFLAPGVEVIVTDEAGDKTRGWVSSISDEQMAVFFEERAAFSRRPAERIFAADSIARIDAPDSTWNGALIGAVVGVGLALAIYSARSEGCNVPGLCPGAVLGGAAALVSVGVGGVIDHRISTLPFMNGHPNPLG